ncbi:ATP-binding protein [Rhodoferax sp.]|uniref:ATP-binding protein n=1 Tax=Rhodoferax sp. TaxID=50421 RepID=UPI00272F3B4B|nr:ATP-binding protein [Rhodoferax sp.]MDP1529844.1 ATP-binding protein [Rhodoferax sp.]MDP1944536.1 ATP-binding protein [Rhodoferax sp.]MDP2440679.1 ATP-binding protein [Rhodoferax sp.]MDZ4208894.1 ATP-binding protein [Rhodoferax sp.]
MFNKLYVRIWLAVVLAVAVLILLVGWAWRLAAEPPLRDIEVRNQAGQIIGKGRSRALPGDDALGPQRHDPPGPGMMRRYELTPLLPPTEPTENDPDALTDPNRPRTHPGSKNPGRGGPEFVVRMHDGQTMRMHLMRAPPSFWSRPPFGFAWMLVWVGLAVALATYPIVRTLTRRLERLQNGVQQWGEGDLSARVPETGEDEVAFLARRFNQAAERVQTLVHSHEALLASQKSLLANASHELRSPLTRIRMGLELMSAGTSSAFKAEITRNINELDQLIEEILLASRLDTREADLGTIESVDLIGLAAEECARVNAELDLPAQLDADTAITELAVPGISKLLRRAVRNLLENARRYGAGEIHLSLSQTESQVVIRVSDHGPGVPPELRERIFEPFYRLPGATERDGGVGLGLALVKAIAQRHSGRVTCEDRPGGGATFVLELPKK